MDVYLVRRILENASIEEPLSRLTQKALMIVEILASARRTKDTLRGTQWREFLEFETATAKAKWLAQDRTTWSKKSAGKVAVTKTLRELTRLFQESGCVSVGASSIPLCLISTEERAILAGRIADLYGGVLRSEFVNWIASRNLPLLVAWITGFKPRGDDSRPDRGLVPLARMLFGDEADILSIVYGPAKPAMWQTLQTSPQQLARQNGLWEAIINLSDALLLDSVTLRDGAFSLVLERARSHFSGKVRFPAAAAMAAFSEHEVDTALHALFAQKESKRIFEAMCNPPGSDWSGMSALDFQSGDEYRWTSLPRVSGISGKRPDHVIQFSFVRSTVFLCIESKSRTIDLEQNVGVRLKTYTRRLLRMPPMAVRRGNKEWSLWRRRDTPLTGFSIIAGGAFCWAGEKSLDEALGRGKLDVAFGFEFKSVEQASLLHVKVSASAEFLLSYLRHLVEEFGGRLEIQIH